MKVIVKIKKKEKRGETSAFLTLKV